VAVILDDEAGRESHRWRGPNSAEGWLKMLGWASRLGSIRRWGVEGAWNYGRGLSQHLVGAGEEVYEVNPRWTAEVRKRSRASWVRATGWTPGPWQISSGAKDLTYPPSSKKTEPPCSTC
jgi:hypothetical protein